MDCVSFLGFLYLSALCDSSDRIVCVVLNGVSDDEVLFIFVIVHATVDCSSLAVSPPHLITHLLSCAVLMYYLLSIYSPILLTPFPHPRIPHIRLRPPLIAPSIFLEITPLPLLLPTYSIPSLLHLPPSLSPTFPPVPPHTESSTLLFAHLTWTP